jgi:hypothetical protein
MRGLESKDALAPSRRHVSRRRAPLTPRTRDASDAMRWNYVEGLSGAFHQPAHSLGGEELPLSQFYREHVDEPSKTKHATSIAFDDTDPTLCMNFFT